MSDQSVLGNWSSELKVGITTEIGADIKALVLSSKPIIP